MSFSSSPPSDLTAPAVCIRKGVFQHGVSFANGLVDAFCGRTEAIRKDTLVDINITVPKGVIYCLMGASGCGKSTLLSCIVGLRRLTSGDISVLGQDPANRHALGHNVAYMPQELALYGEFDISETLYYFGRLCGAVGNNHSDSDEDKDKGGGGERFRKRVKDILELMELPPKGRLVKKLSGGQQRRVSLAACLVHEPRLLVLDEPTAGLDARIRTRIWKYLHKLVSTSEGVSVIVTTHHEEEARKAHIFAIMQSGRILAEDSPAKMVASFGMSSLDDVIIHVLCLAEDEHHRHRQPEEEVVQAAGVVVAVKSLLAGCRRLSSRLRTSGRRQQYDVEAVTEMEAQTSNSEPKLLEYRPDSEVPVSPHIKKESGGCCQRPEAPISWRRTSSLLVKNFTTLRRSKALLAFSFLMPALVVISFCSALGRNPHNLRLAIVNGEAADCAADVVGKAAALDCLEPHGLACRFMDELFRFDTFVKAEAMVDMDEARATVEAGYTWGVIEIGSNFSKALLRRLEEGGFADVEVIHNSTTWVRVDGSSTEVLRSLQVGVARAYQSFLEGVLRECVGSTDGAAQFIRFADLHSGSQLDDLEQRPRLMEFMAPGIITLIAFFLPMAATSVTFLLERANGLLDRSIVAGVRPAEIVVSHVASQMAVLTAQVATAMAVMLAAYQVPCAGSVCWLAALAVAHGATGMCYGILISTLCSDMVTSIYVALGSFLPIILLGGIVASLESMSPGLRAFCQLLPCTLPCQAMRDIMSRGWSIDAVSVQAGFVASFVWAVVFVVIACVAIKIRIK